MKTKQEQIEEMRKEIENGFRKADCRQPYTNEPYPYFETQKTAIAKALYDAGYRKVPDWAVVITPEERDDLIARVGNLGRENYDLKTENEKLKAKLEKIPLAIKQKIMEEDDYELTEREQATLFLDRMGSDLELLHDMVENLDELLGKGIDEYIMGRDGVEGLKDMWERSAVRAFAEKLRKRLTEDRVSNDNVVINANYEIDEMLKEYE